MRVAMHVDGPVIRGNERQAVMIAAGLIARGHEVAVSCRAGGPVETAMRAAGARTTGVRPGGDADVWNALRFVHWLRTERPDALLLTSWKRAFVGAWAGRAAGVPRVVLRMGGVHDAGPLLRRLLKGGAMRRACHAVVANSRTVAEHLVRTVPLPPERVALVHNGVEAPPAPFAGLRETLGVGASALLAVAVGDMERRKGFDLLVDALPAAPGVHAMLVGGGPEEARAALEARAAARGVAARVHFLGRREDAAAVAAACDLFVLPSRSEGMSVAMLEAMAAGIPVVAADVGGVADALGAQAGRPAAGWIVPAGDPAALGEALAAADRDLRSGGEIARAHVGEASWRVARWFSPGAMAERYEAVLRGEAP